MALEAIKAEYPELTDDEKRKYPISFREGFTVFTCLGVSLAAIMALVIYVGFFWYLEQQRMLKGKQTRLPCHCILLIRPTA